MTERFGSPFNFAPECLPLFILDVALARSSLLLLPLASFCTPGALSYMWGLPTPISQLARTTGPCGRAAEVLESQSALSVGSGGCSRLPLLSVPGLLAC